MKRRRSLRHISESALPHIRAELSRSLLGRYLDAGAMRTEQARVLGRETIAQPKVTVRRKSAMTKPGDPRQLRGIPVVGVEGGMGGAMIGSRPTDAIRNVDREAGLAGLDESAYRDEPAVPQEEAEPPLPPAQGQ